MKLIDALELYYEQREGRREAKRPDEPRFDKKQIAAAALAVEMSRADDEVTDAEREAIHRVVCTRFGLSSEDAESLIETASRRDFRRLFTDPRKSALTDAERIDIVETMLKVAFADGQYDAPELALARRVANMLGLDQSDLDAAKARVRGQLDAG